MQAFTAQDLERIRSLLSPIPPYKPGSFPAHTAWPSASGKLKAVEAKEAAVLIPLMNLKGEPHVLLEVRASKMRTHAGEVSFPGGRIDLDDVSIASAALREAQEELALDPKHVEILGALDIPEYALGNRSRVWAIVAYLRPEACALDPITPPTENDEPLPPFPITQLIPSPDEVAHILPMPLNFLSDPHRLSMHLFRIDARRPYWKIGVGDLVPENILPQRRSPQRSVLEAGRQEQVPPIQEGRLEQANMSRLEVWGLSGWFLNKLAWRVGWMEQPEPLVEPED